MSEVDEEPPLDYSETDMVEEETAVTTTTTTTTKEKEDTSRDEVSQYFATHAGPCTSLSLLCTFTVT
jgi:hypothetical protein